MLLSANGVVSAICYEVTMESLSEKGLDAAADKLDAVGRHHGWWQVSYPSWRDSIRLPMKNFSTLRRQLYAPTFGSRPANQFNRWGNWPASCCKLENRGAALQADG